MKFCFLITIVFLFFFSCQSGGGKSGSETDKSNNQVRVIDVVHAPSYTYVNMEGESGEFWIAVAPMEIQEGEVYYLGDALEMKDFYSRELDWTFDRIYFVSQISASPITGQKSSEESGHMTSPHAPGRPASEKLDISIAPQQGSISIAVLYENREKYSGQTVKVAGQVTRFNPGIMNRNWVHIQDGSEHNGNFGITVTTPDHVHLGDKVIVEGQLELDRDFGAGYFYNLIIENASVKKLVLH